MSRRQKGHERQAFTTLLPPALFGLRNDVCLFVEGKYEACEQVDNLINVLEGNDLRLGMHIATGDADQASSHSCTCYLNVICVSACEGSLAVKLPGQTIVFCRLDQHCIDSWVNTSTDCDHRATV